MELTEQDYFHESKFVALRQTCDNFSYMMHRATIVLFAALALLPATAFSQSDKAVDPCQSERDETGMEKCRQNIVKEQTRACRHLSQTIAQTKCSPARKFRAVFS